MDPFGFLSADQESGWHVYTATFGRVSSVRMDGTCEASSPRGTPELLPRATTSGLTVGADAAHNFPMTGAIAQVRVFQGELPDTHRELIEMALAQRYGLDHAGARSDGPPAKRQRRE